MGDDVSLSIPIHSDIEDKINNLIEGYWVWFSKKHNIEVNTKEYRIRSTAGTLQERPDLIIFAVLRNKSVSISYERNNQRNYIDLLNVNTYTVKQWKRMETDGKQTMTMTIFV